jgi:molecular chaperone GrpE
MKTMSPDRHEADPVNSGPSKSDAGETTGSVPDSPDVEGPVGDASLTSSDEESPESNPRNQGGQASLAELQEALGLAHAEVLRSHAELENYRKRARRDMEEERRYACLPLMRDLLPVMDNLQRALIHASQAGGDSEALLAGVRMVAQELASTLEKHHCYPVESAGVPFDPNYHEAIGQQPSSDVAAGHVALVVTDGYRLHDRVIRPSQVLVSTGSPNSNP